MKGKIFRTSTRSCCVSSVRSRFCNGLRLRFSEWGGRGGLLAVMCIAFGVLPNAGCAGAVESSKLEDNARRTVPVPICLKALERRSGGAVSVVRPEDYWGLVLPSYDPGGNTVDRSSPDCSGRTVFDKPELSQAEGVRSGALLVKP